MEAIPTTAGPAPARGVAEEQEDCRPNVVVYTAAISACVLNKAALFEKVNHEQEQMRSFEIAEKVMEELEFSPYASPNFLSYAAFLSVCSSALPEHSEQRDRVVSQTFRRCCDNGAVGRKVIEHLKDAASPKLFKDLLSGCKDWHDIPPSWRSRVVGERYDGRRPSAPSFS